MASRPPVGPTLVFVDDLDAPTLSSADHHHLARVLRMRVGAEITIADGTGSWRRAVLADGPVPGELGPVATEPQPRPDITVAFGLTKGAKPELVVQKLTELGVQRIAGFVAARSVVVWDETKRLRNQHRWSIVAREACMQSRRARLPSISPIVDFAEVVSWPGAAMAAMGGASPTLDNPVVLIGPEGGWSDEESAVPVPRFSLGDHVLRAETAAIAAGAVLSALRGRRE